MRYRVIEIREPWEDIGKRGMVTHAMACSERIAVPSLGKVSRALVRAEAARAVTTVLQLLLHGQQFIIVCHRAHPHPVEHCHRTPPG